MTAGNRAVLKVVFCFALAAAAARAATQSAQMDEVTFDHPGGFCQSTFNLSLGTPAEGTTIYYTTNGDDPQPANASLYLRPIPITATTIVRAATFDPAVNLTGTAGTRTFLFVADVLKQTGAQFSKTWGTNHGKPVPACYGMTTTIEQKSVERETVATGLRSIPTLSIIASPADLFSPETGIYTHPMERGVNWERRVSLEMFDADGRLAFQCHSGLRIHGGMSRQPEESPKHSFRLTFKKRYGAARLQFPLFGANGTQAFDTLILRAGNNDSWLSSQCEERRRADYLRDEWMRRSMSDMGHPSARGRFVQLYLNGLYWGVYDLCEQPSPDLLAGDETATTGFDVRKAGKIEAGDEVAWNQMMTLANAGVSDDRSYEEISRYLDLPELADYLILNFYAGNSDWDRSANWFAIRPRTPGGRFQFLVWDGECTLGNPDVDTLDFDDDESPPRLFHKLSENAAFRKLFAIRAQQLLFKGGPLAPEKSAERYRALADPVASALTAEAARWGNYRRDVQPYKTGPYETYTVEQHWRPETNRLLTRYFPRRREVLLNQLRERGLFADQLAEP